MKALDLGTESHGLRGTARIVEPVFPFSGPAFLIKPKGEPFLLLDYWGPNKKQRIRT